ncbi:hypothetical protein H5410_048577 [Solanum commersonii]|uniref:Uncharacterized protein n=1 Tax=Solanum commersonii TaxID=4109 RepID=A0A9J5XKW1_SOLCO|nr:hypothetical protein H5410_048577 [Solanum commersonii]
MHPNQSTTGTRLDHNHEKKQLKTEKNRTTTQNNKLGAQCQIINVINLEMLKTTCRNIKDGKSIIEEEALPFSGSGLRR